jgi:hypothetical protein
VRVVQHLLDVVDQLGLKIRAVQRAHLGRSSVHAVAVSFAHGDDNVSLKETGDARILVVSRTHVALGGHCGVRLTTWRSAADAPDSGQITR